MFSAVIKIGIFLFPFGVGYRFSVGHVDIPRLFFLALIPYWFVYILWGFFKSKMIRLKPGTKPIILLVFDFDVGHFLINPVASTILAGQLCLMWFVFAVANESLFNHYEDVQLLNAALIIIFVLKIFRFDQSQRDPLRETPQSTLMHCPVIELFSGDDKYTASEPTSSPRGKEPVAELAA